MNPESISKTSAAQLRALNVFSSAGVQYLDVSIIEYGSTQADPFHLIAPSAWIHEPWEFVLPPIIGSLGRISIPRIRLTRWETGKTSDSRTVVVRWVPGIRVDPDSLRYATIWCIDKFPVLSPMPSTVLSTCWAQPRMAASVLAKASPLSLCGCTENINSRHSRLRYSVSWVRYAKRRSICHGFDPHRVSGMLITLAHDSIAIITASRRNFISEFAASSADHCTSIPVEVAYDTEERIASSTWLGLILNFFSICKGEVAINVWIRGCDASWSAW